MNHKIMSQFFPEEILRRTGLLFRPAAYLAMLVLVFSVPAGAGISPKAGTTSLNFLKVGIGARPAALGGAFCAVSDDASACFWNPAGLLDGEPMELFFMHHRFIADISQSAASFAFDVRNVRLGVSMNYFNMGELERRTSNSLTPEGTFTPFDMALGVSGAYRITERLSAGLTARIVHENIDSESARAVLFDIGIKSKTMFPGLSTALTVRNLGNALKYIGTGYDAPRLVSLGAAYRKSMPWAMDAVLVTAEIISPNDNSARLAVGGEYSYRDFLVGRIGYRTALEAEDVSFGFGVHYLSLRFDYAFVPYSDLGDSHRFSFFYGF